jgi:hypothetical protein
MIAISREIWAIMHVEHLFRLSGLGHRIHSLERIARKRVVAPDTFFSPNFHAFGVIGEIARGTIKQLSYCR